MAATEKSAGEPGGTPEVSDGLWNGVRRFFIRLGVHLLAAFAATLAWMMLPEFYPEGGFTVWFSVYMGLICLLPYGKFSDPSWHVPTLAGVIQWLLTWLSGLPGQAALFFAGLSVWVQRLIGKKGRHGFEWAAVPGLMLGVALWHNSYAQPNFHGGALLIMPVVIVIGVVVQWILVGLRNRAIRHGDFTRLLARLKLLSRSPLLSHELRTQTLQLFTQTENYTRLANLKAIEGDAILERVALETVALDGYERGRNGQDVPPMFNFIKSRAKRTDVLAGQLLEELRELNVAVAGEIKSREAAARAQIKDDLTALELRVKALVDRGAALSARAAESLSAIAASSAVMFDQMRTDPADRNPGETFFNRYLKHLETLIDDYQRLSKSGAESDKVKAALAHAEEVLSHLQEAFAAQARFMVENDLTRFNAGVKALDTFISMHGQ